MAFDDERGARKLLGLGVADRETYTVRGRHVLGRNRFTCAGIGGERHPDRLVADGLAQNRGPALGYVALVDVVLVWVDRPLDNGFAQAVGRRDEHYLIESGFGVERE